jgi:organic hydroperoxide reductase OsmC/OhrA
MAGGLHRYTARVVWAGNSGTGTSAYGGYSRRHRIRIAGKPDLWGTADAAFLGEAERHNPEDLFVSAIAACHMLSYLALCAGRGVRIEAYEDEALGTMRLEARGGGRFEEILLRPAVTVARAEDTALAQQLHESAHERCFIANSCAVPIRCVPAVHVAALPGTEGAAKP